MTSEILGIFLKSPVPGKCKTRLCPPLTHEQSAALYRSFCQDVVETAGKTSKQMRMMYDPSPEFPTPHWVAPNIPFLVQEGPTLGEKLIHAFGSLFAEGFSRVVIIGTDSPALPTDHIENAFELLRQHDAVFGPAIDGGYYLVGLSKPQPALFQEIPWSTNQVMLVTRQRVQDLRLLAGFLPTHSDVDTAEDLMNLVKYLKSQPKDVAHATRVALGEIH